MRGGCSVTPEEIPSAQFYPVISSNFIPVMTSQTFSPCTRWSEIWTGGAPPLGMHLFAIDVSGPLSCLTGS